MRQLINIVGSLMFGFGFCDFGNSFLLLDGLVNQYFSMNVTLLSPRLTSQEQVARQFSDQHPTKQFLIL